MRRTNAGLAILGLWLFSAPVHADISPPEPTKKTLELTLDGQESFPDLRFLALNCRKSPRESVLQKGKSIECPSIPHPVRIFGFRAGDLDQLFAMIERDAGVEESRKFLDAKARTCGEITSTEVLYPGGGHRRFVSRYAVEPTPGGGCKLRKISSKTLNEPEPSTDDEDSLPAPSTKPATSAPTPAAPTPAPSKSSCGCRTVSGDDSDRSALSLVAFWAMAALRKRRGHSMR